MDGAYRGGWHCAAVWLLAAALWQNPMVGVVTAPEAPNTHDPECVEHLKSGLLALARAARAFGIYDPYNDAVKRYLLEYRNSMFDALQGGDLKLSVRPFDLVLGSTIVYHDQDREKSLAFLLFRDGVRQVLFYEDVGWEELAILLEVVVTCMVGRQREHDFVTLYYKEPLDNIRIMALDGFYEEGADVAMGGRAGAGAAPNVEVPQDWDLPIGVPPDADQPCTYTPRNQQQLEALLDELEPQGTPDLAMVLMGELFGAVRDEYDPMKVADVGRFVGEVRDYLLRKKKFDHALKLLDELRALEQIDPKTVEYLLDGFCGHRFLGALIDNRETVGLKRIQQTLDDIPGNHLVGLIHLLERRRRQTDPDRIQVITDLVKNYVNRDPNYILENLTSLPAERLPDVLTGLVGSHPRLRLEVTLLLSELEGDEVLPFALQLLSETTPRAGDLPALEQLLGKDAYAGTAAQLMGRLGNIAAVPMLDACLEAGPSPEVAAEVGRALAVLSSVDQEGRMMAWIRPEGTWKRMSHVHVDRVEHYAAVAGLTQIDAQRHEKLIRWLAKRASKGLADFCMRTLVQARRNG